MAQEDVVGGSSDSWKVLQGDESNVVDEDPEYAEPHLCGNKESHFILNLIHY